MYMYRERERVNATESTAVKRGGGPLEGMSYTTWIDRERERELHLATYV